MDDGLLYEIVVKDILVVIGYYFVFENCLFGMFGVCFKNY